MWKRQGRLIQELETLRLAGLEGVEVVGGGEEETKEVKSGSEDTLEPELVRVRVVQNGDAV